MDLKRYLIRRYKYCKTSLKENLEKEEIQLKKGLWRINPHEKTKDKM